MIGSGGCEVADASTFDGCLGYLPRARAERRAALVALVTIQPFAIVPGPKKGQRASRIRRRPSTRTSASGAIALMDA